jgi:hypothetical protein
MNRGVAKDFHFAIESSSEAAVNWMWKLCMTGERSESGQSCSRDSEKIGTDFSHQRLTSKVVTEGELKEFSTSPRRLLLLLV